MRRITLLIASMALMVLLVATAALAIERQCRAGTNCFGTDERDRLEGSGGDDNIFGLGGNDVILGDFGDDDIFAGAGNDSVFGGPDEDDISGGSGNDVLRGQGGEDAISTGDGEDRVLGGQGDDFIDAFDPENGRDRDPDLILCGGGVDEVWADVNDDVVTSGPQDCEIVHRFAPPSNFFAENDPED